MYRVRWLICMFWDIIIVLSLLAYSRSIKKIIQFVSTIDFCTWHNADVRSIFVWILAKQSVNKPRFTEAFGTFHRNSFYFSNFLAKKRSSSENHTNFMHIRCTALTSNFNKPSQSDFNYLVNILVLSSYFISNTGKTYTKVSHNK